MRKTVQAGFILASLVLLSACESERVLTDGVTTARCVGVNQRKDPAFVYEYSARNLLVAVFAVELIVPPIMVVLNGLECPVSRTVTP